MKPECKYNVEHSFQTIHLSPKTQNHCIHPPENWWYENPGYSTVSSDHITETIRALFSHYTTCTQTHDSTNKCILLTEYPVTCWY